MGLSASQGRLLSLTSRMSDLERRSQSISNQKMRLTSLSSAASQKYQNALNMEKITFNNGYRNVEATATNLTEYNPNITTQRFLNTADGKLVVDSTTANALSSCGGDLDTYLNRLGLSADGPVVNRAANMSNGLINSTSLVMGQIGASVVSDSLAKLNNPTTDNLTELANNLKSMDTEASNYTAGLIDLYNSGLADSDVSKALSDIVYNQDKATSTDNFKNVLGLQTVQVNDTNMNGKAGIKINESEDLDSAANALITSLNLLGAANSTDELQKYETSLSNVANSMATYFGVSITADDINSDSELKEALSYEVPNIDENGYKDNGSISGTDSNDDGKLSASENDSLTYTAGQLTAEKTLTATASENSNSLYNQMKAALEAQGQTVDEAALQASMKKVLASYLSQVPYDFAPTNLDTVSSSDAVKASVENQKFINSTQTLESIAKAKAAEAGAHKPGNPYENWHTETYTETFTPSPGDIPDGVTVGYIPPVTVTKTKDVFDGYKTDHADVQSIYNSMSLSEDNKVVCDNNDYEKYISNVVTDEAKTNYTHYLGTKEDQLTSNTNTAYNNGESQGAMYYDVNTYMTGAETYLNKEATETNIVNLVKWAAGSNAEVATLNDDTSSYLEGAEAAEADNLFLYCNTNATDAYSISSMQAMKAVMNEYETSVYGASASQLNAVTNDEGDVVANSYTRLTKEELMASIQENVTALFDGVESTAPSTDIAKTVNSYLAQIDNYTQYMDETAQSTIASAKEKLAAMNGDYSSSLTGTLGALSEIKSVLGEEHFTNATISGLEYDEGKITYYTNIFNEVMNRGGVPDGYAILENKNAKSAEWLNTNLSNGNLYLSTKEDTADTTELSSRINYKSDDMCINVESDDSYIAQAEAEYDAAMTEINAKEKRLDIELEQNNTEYSAVQKEMESVEKVMEKNIDRSFKLFA